MSPCSIAVLGALAGPQRFGVPVMRATAALGYATVPAGWEPGPGGDNRQDKGCQREGGQL